MQTYVFVIEGDLCNHGIEITMNKIVKMFINIALKINASFNKIYSLTNN